MNKIETGKFIYQLRKEKGLSQYQLADMIPISRQAISKWENGINTPDSNTLLVLSQIFGVTVNELLLGKRLSNENASEEIQEVTLNILNQNEVKSKKIKKLYLTIFISFTLFIISFLLYYFITSYNSIKLYVLEGESKNFKINNGLFIITKDKIYLRLNEIKSDNNYEINELVLYYLDNDEEKLIISRDDLNVIITERYGYDEYFEINKIDTILDNLFLRVIYDDKSEDIKINNKKDYANNKVFLSKRKTGSNDDENKVDEVVTASTNIIDTIDFDKMNCDDISCNLIINNEKSIEFNYFKENSILQVTVYNEVDKINWLYDFANDKVKYTFYSNNDVDPIVNITFSTHDINDKNYKYYAELVDNYINKYLR